jgi:hypothetical protein
VRHARSGAGAEHGDELIEYRLEPRVVVGVSVEAAGLEWVLEPADVVAEGGAHRSARLRAAPGVSGNTWGYRLRESQGTGSFSIFPSWEKAEQALQSTHSPVRRARRSFFF